MDFNFEDISNKFMNEGFFSEYLPPNFNLKHGMFDIFNDIPIAQKNDYIEPYKYTMSKSSKNDRRRIISLPEITAYIDTVKYMKENGFLEELINKSLESTTSFSRLINNGEFIKHEQIYYFSDDLPDGKSSFMSNTIKKINRAKGAIGILHVDISNFYGSIYTHLLPSIILGYEVAMKQFKLASKNNNSSNSIENQYRKYCELDKKIRLLNGNRTNGLLVGPMVSRVISEALLTRIDSEILDKNIIFTRYVDDYDIYIYDDRDIEQTTNIIIEILSKYHLSLNTEKIKYTSFPYYKFENLEKIIKSYPIDNLEEDNLIQLFNTFFQLESNGTKGSIRYLIKSIPKSLKPLNNELSLFSIQKRSFSSIKMELYTTYLLNTLVNDTNSLTKICELLIAEKYENKIVIDENSEKIIENLLLSCIDSKKDLEVIWLLYLMKNLNLINLRKDIAKKVIHSKNELAILVLIYEFSEEIYGEFINYYCESASSWIFLYQLFLRNEIDKETFMAKSEIKNNIKFYTKLKYRNFSFYKKINDNPLDL